MKVVLLSEWILVVLCVFFLMFMMRIVNRDVCLLNRLILWLEVGEYSMYLKYKWESFRELCLCVPIQLSPDVEFQVFFPPFCKIHTSWLVLLQNNSGKITKVINIFIFQRISLRIFSFSITKVMWFDEVFLAF